MQATAANNGSPRAGRPVQEVCGQRLRGLSCAQAPGLLALVDLLLQSFSLIARQVGINARESYRNERTRSIGPFEFTEEIARQTCIRLTLVEARCLVYFSSYDGVIAADKRIAFIQALEFEELGGTGLRNIVINIGIYDSARSIITNQYQGLTSES